VHHAQPRAARAVLVEEPEVAIGPLAWLAAVTGSAGSQPAITSKIATAAGSRAVRTRLCSRGRPHRLSVAIARRFRLTRFEPLVPQVQHF